MGLWVEEGLLLSLKNLDLGIWVLRQKSCIFGIYLPPKNLLDQQVSRSPTRIYLTNKLPCKDREAASPTHFYGFQIHCHSLPAQPSCGWGMQTLLWCVYPTRTRSARQFSSERAARPIHAFLNYWASWSLSCSMQASRGIVRDLPWGAQALRLLWLGGSVVVVGELALWHVGCGVLVSQPGIKPALQGRLLTTGPPQKSPSSCFQGTEFRATSKTQLNESQALTFGCKYKCYLELFFLMEEKNLHGQLPEYMVCLLQGMFS